MDLKKALKDFNEAIKVSQNDSKIIYYCNKGVILYILGKNEQGLKSFEEAENLVGKDGKVKGLTKQNIDYIKNLLESLIKLKNEFEEAKNEVASNKLLQQFQENYKKLKEDFYNFLFHQNNLNNKYILDHTELTETIIQVTENLEKVKNDIKVLRENFEKEINVICSNLSKKLDNNNKLLKLNIEKLSMEDQTKIEGYYKSFIETIAAAYLTAQVVNSGQLEIKKNVMLSIISGAISIVPIIGTQLSKGIEVASIPLTAILSGGFNLVAKGVDKAGNFKISKSIKQNSKNIKQLALDSSDLSEKVSKLVISIVENENKRKEILGITEEKLKELPDELLEMIKKFCSNQKTKLEESLYGKLFSTPAEKLGNKDANLFIKNYLQFKANSKSNKQLDRFVFEADMQIIIRNGSFELVKNNTI